MQLTDDTLTKLAGMQDPVGVLSIFIDASPERQMGDRPLEVGVRHSLRRLVDQVHEEGPRERWRALSERLEQIEPELSRLLDTGEPGRGRALFAGLTGGRAESLSLQVPLEEAVVLDEHAYLRPLVAALDAGCPIGVVTVSRNGVRAVHLRLGLAEEAAHFKFHDGTDPDPRAGTEGPATNAGSQKEQFERYLAQNRDRFLQSVAQDLVELAAEREWDPVFVVGDPRLTQPVSEALRKPNGREVILKERVLEWRTPDEIARAFASELEDVHVRRELRLVEQARDAALGPGTGALGLRDTLAALGEGRVAHLLVEDGREHAGSRTADGRLSPAGEPPVGASEDELEPEPRLVERMIERAIETSARVTIVRGPASEVLAEYEGVAAILRW